VVGPFDLRDGGDNFSRFEPTTLIAGKPNQIFTARMQLLVPGQSEDGVAFVYFYASADPVITASDYYLGRTSIAGRIGGSSTLTLRTMFPMSIPAGTYYVGWIIDPDNSMLEADENNNTAFKTAPLLTVVNPSESTIYVDASADGTNDGSSWANAFTTLQDALPLAGSVREIRMADGVYTPDRGLGVTRGDRGATFKLTGGLTIQGGYAGTGAPDPDARDTRAYATILSGDLTANDLPVADPANLWKEVSRTDNSRHVLTASGSNGTPILDGVQVSGGYAFGSSTSTADSAGLRGAGLIVSGASLIARNCTFSDNWASGDGGALYVANGGRLELTDGTFRANGAGTNVGQARGTGGAIRNDGAGQLALAGCKFYRNFAGAQGGAFDNSRGHVILTRCSFIQNSAGSAGGGAVWNSEGQLTLVNCTLNSNRSGFSGGAIVNGWSGTLNAVNCCLHANYAQVQAGALDNCFGGRTTLSNCTLVGNRQDGTLHAIVCGPALDQTDSELTIANSILWNGGNEISNLGQSLATVGRTDIQGGWAGTGNLNAVPLFILPAGLDGVDGTEDDNLRLGAGSPCVDHGDNALLPDDFADLNGNGNLKEPLPFDLDAKARVAGTAVDMGAYEAQASALAASSASGGSQL